ncbi:MAG: MFS transporter [Clostridia bacterium]|nr:MFS transporter [Clostridia bacterium]
MTMTNLSKKRVIFVMIGVMLSVLLAALDSTIVGTAMPKVINDLHGMDKYAWPFTAYMLCSTIVIPIFGKMADIYGRKPIYFIGLIIFLIASALCGLSQTMMQLIIFRGLQGIGGGILMSNAFAIVGDMFSPAERAKYMGIVVSVFGLSSVVGPTLGGYITDNLNWRWVFYVNIPVGIAAMVTMFVALPYLKDTSLKRVIDYAGAAALIVSLVPMLLAFTWAGKDYEWLSPQIIGMLVFSTVMLIVFGYIESKAAEPIIPLSLFKSSVFNISSLAGFLSNSLMFGAVMFIPLFVQVVIGSSASTSGMVTTPMMLSLVIASIIAGQLISRVGKYKLMAVGGFILSVIGAVLMATIDMKTSNTTITLYMIVLGIGIGVIMPIINITVQNAFPQSQLGIVTSAMQFFRNIGATISSAIFGSVMISHMNKGLSEIDLSRVPNEELKGFFRDPQALTNVEAINAVRQHMPEAAIGLFDKLMDQVKEIITSSLHQVFLICIVISVIGFITILFLKEIPLKGRQTSKQNEESSQGMNIPGNLEMAE